MERGFSIERILSDWKEICDDPIPNINVFPKKDNFLKE
jgi:hypothetical protein